MYILVQAGIRKGANIIAIAASEDIQRLKDFAARDACKEFGVNLDGNWGTDQVFPYIVLPEHKTQYYIREIEYV